MKRFYRRHNNNKLAELDCHWKSCAASWTETNLRGCNLYRGIYKTPARQPAVYIVYTHCKKKGWSASISIFFRCSIHPSPFSNPPQPTIITTRPASRYWHGTTRHRIDCSNVNDRDRGFFFFSFFFYPFLLSSLFFGIRVHRPRRNQLKTGNKYWPFPSTSHPFQSPFFPLNQVTRQNLKAFFLFLWFSK